MLYTYIPNQKVDSIIISVPRNQKKIFQKSTVLKMSGTFTNRLGLARNTPDYIWKLEAGKRSVEVETRRRAAKYIVEILKRM